MTGFVRVFVKNGQFLMGKIAKLRQFFPQNTVCALA